MLVAPRDGLSLGVSSADDVWVVPPLSSGAVAHRVTAERVTPKGVLVQLTGVEDAAVAHEAAGRWIIGVGEEDALAAGERERWIGLTVTDRERGLLGQVSEVIVTGANDVLVVEGGPFGQVLVPVIDDVRISIDEESATITLTLLEGLIDGEGV